MLKINQRKIAIALLAVSVLWISGCATEKDVESLYGVELEASEKEALPDEENLVNYMTVQAMDGEFTRTVSKNISVYYPLTADLVCEKENASVREIFIKGRQPVKKGEELIALDIEVSNAAVEEYTLKLQRCMEEMEAGKKTRLEEIHNAEVQVEGLGGLELELALLKLEKLQSEYDEFVYVSEQEAAKYQKEVEKLENEKEGYILTAPFDGVLDYMERLKVGDRVEPGQVLIKMYAEDPYYLSVEDLVGNLRYNTEVTIYSGPKNETKTYVGKVVSAYNMLLPEVPKGNALIRLEEEVASSEFAGALRYEAEIEKLQNVLLINEDVVQTDGDKSYVRILENDMIQKRYIVSGLKNADVVWVLDGLSKEQKVIAE